jgi:hypothetical protein
LLPHSKGFASDNKYEEHWTRRRHSQAKPGVLGGRALRSHLASFSWGAYPHLNEVPLSIVNKGNGFAVLLCPTDGHGCAASRGMYLQDGDVIQSLPKSVVNLERFPILGKAACKTKPIHFQFQSRGGYAPSRSFTGEDGSQVFPWLFDVSCN